jgi:diguanylate cyclase (GGDEF)-like protein
LDTLLRIDLNVFSVLVAIVLALSMRNRNEHSFLDYKLFMLMLWGSAFELVVDTAMWLCEGNAASFGHELIMTESLLYYLVHPFVPMSFAIFAAYRVSGNVRRLRSSIRFFLIPASVSAVLCLSTPLTGWYFSVDRSNFYHRGALFWLFIAINVSYLVFAFLYVIARSRRAAVDSKTLASLLLFPVLPIAAGVAQVVHYGLVLIWPSIVLALLVIYVNIQQRKLSSDYLTGIFNRRRLDEYLASRVREIGEPRRGRTKFLAGFLADIDDFKRINDNFGHVEGDAALIEAVKLIRSGLRSEDFLARYAGDEFVAVFSVSGEAELKRIVERVRSRFEGESRPEARYRLTLSIGAALFDPALDADADRFVARLDSLMYNEKAIKQKS